MITDIIVVAALIVSGVLAMFRGFVRETLTVIGWVGAAFATLYGYQYLAPVLGEVITSGLLVDIVAAGTIFIITLVILTILTHIVSNRVKGSMLGHLDSALGFVFGLLRGAVLVSLVYVGATLFWDERNFPGPIASAKTLPLIRTGAGMLARLAPEDVVPGRRDFGRRVDDAVSGAVEGAARDQLDQMIEEIEAEDRLRRLTQPEPETAPPPDEEAQPVPPPGYDDAQRREMQRLIESNQ